MKIKLSQLRRIISEEVRRIVETIKTGDQVEIVKPLEKMGHASFGFKKFMTPTGMTPIKGVIEFDGGDGSNGTVGTIYFDENDDMDLGVESVWVTQNDIDNGAVKLPNVRLDFMKDPRWASAKKFSN